MVAFSRPDLLVKAVRLIMADAGYPISDGASEWDSVDRVSWEKFCQDYACKYTPVPEYGMLPPIFRLFIDDKVKLLQAEYERRGMPGDVVVPENRIPYEMLPPVGSGVPEFEVDDFGNVQIRLDDNGNSIPEVTFGKQKELRSQLERVFTPQDRTAKKVVTPNASKTVSTGDQRRPVPRPTMRPPAPTQRPPVEIESTAPKPTPAVKPEASGWSKAPIDEPMPVVRTRQS